MMSNSQIFSESKSVKMFVLSIKQHFPSLLLNIPSVKCKTELGGEERRGRMRNGEIEIIVISIMY